MEYVNTIYELYDNGIGTNEIARKIGKHRSTVQSWLKKRNGKLRKRSPQGTYNIKFFDTYTLESCYWAGFFLADGHVRNNCRACDLHLAPIDIDHLHKFAKAIDFRGNIEHCKDGSIRLTVSGKWFPEKLQLMYGIGPQKTETTSFPNIPEQYWNHFIRGFHDGDGCITYTTVPSINFTSTNNMLLSLREIFYNRGVRLKTRNIVPPIQKKRHVYGQLNYSGKNACIILSWLYSESADEIRLTRKYNRWIEYFDGYREQE